MNTNVPLQIRHLKKERFINAYKSSLGNISRSAQLARINRDTYYQWLKDDQNFAVAINDAEAQLNDEVRAILINEARKGNMTAIIFYLKHRDPQFKEERSQVNIQVNNDKNDKLEGIASALKAILARPM